MFISPGFGTLDRGLSKTVPHTLSLVLWLQMVFAKQFHLYEVHAL